jgi:glycine cleavage system H lipoate-binding protein/ABC-type phosphate transport system substrate-binding protein
MSLNLKIMKTKVLVFIGVALLFCSNVFSKEEVAKDNQAQKGSISVLTTPELYDLATKWATEYSSLNPGLKINVINSNDAKTTNVSEAGANFGIIAGDHAAANMSEPLWKMSVGRDVIVPVISSKNPFLDELYQKGISAEKFGLLFNNPGKEAWGTILGNSQNAPVHLYIVNDEIVRSAVERFINVRQIPVEGIYSGSEEEVIAAVQNDPFAVGFCKMVNIIGPDKESMIENISLLPIDKNANGKIDYMEKIYDNANVFARGVWIGKYPKTLSSDVYVVSSGQPGNQTEIAFIRWMLTDGQQFLYANGLSGLVYSEKQSKLDKFNAINVVLPSKEIYTFPVLMLLFLTIILILSIIISIIVFYRRNRKLSVPAAKSVVPLVFSQDSVIVPGGLYYDKTHTWVYMEKDGAVKIGIDDFLQHITGPISRIDMKSPGEKIRKGDIVLSIIQKGKQLNIYAPISGTILSQNRGLISHSSLINSSPFSDGWVYMIAPANWVREIQFLDMAEKYKAWLLNEFSRLKDFLAVSLKVNKLEYEHVVLQDGGYLKDSILEDLGPEVWEDFQTNFLDTYR